MLGKPGASMYDPGEVSVYRQASHDLAHPNNVQCARVVCKLIYDWLEQPMSAREQENRA